MSTSARPSWKSQCFTLLEAMNSSKGMDEQTEIYSLVLDAIGEEFSLKAVQWAVLHEEWRPAPAKLREIAARVASPYPSVDDAYAEIMDKLQNVGLYGKPRTDGLPGTELGPPPMSHPVVSRIIPHMGGWEYVCTGEAQMQEGLRKQVAGSHMTVSKQWEQEVATQLTLPPDRRNPLYFRPYKTYKPLCPATEFEIPALPPAPKRFEDFDLVKMPAPVKKLIACIQEKAREQDTAMSKPTAKEWYAEEEPQFAGMSENTTRAERERHLAEIKQAQANPRYRLEDFVK